jgi:hypothetical protein
MLLLLCNSLNWCLSRLAAAQRPRTCCGYRCCAAICLALPPQARSQAAARCWRHVPLLLLLLGAWWDWPRRSCACGGLQLAPLACPVCQLPLLLRCCCGKLWQRRHHSIHACPRPPVAGACLPAICRCLLLPLVLLLCCGGPSPSCSPACCRCGGKRSVANRRGVNPAPLRHAAHSLVGRLLG